MKKINWFVRIWWSWNRFEKHFATLGNDQVCENDLQKLKISLAVADNQVLMLKETAEDFKAWRGGKEAELKRLEQENVDLKQELHKTKIFGESLSEKIVAKDLDLSKYIEKNKSLEDKIASRQRELESLKTDIALKLDPLNRIQKTFFAETGNKGKGNLGERGLKVMLEKSGMDKNFWTESLMVGKEQVEFAIKAGVDQKWIPVDSKVLEHEVDSENNVMVDEKFKQKVQTQAKEVTKYLNKENTADYGLLVLQNDAIYIAMFDKNPAFFEKMIREHKIYICSPSSFIQFAWSIGNIIEIYQRVHQDEQIYDQMIDALTSMNKLARALVETHVNFNTAMNFHWPTLQKRQSKLIQKLDREGKLKQLPASLIANKDET